MYILPAFWYVLTLLCHIELIKLKNIINKINTKSNNIYNNHRYTVSPESLFGQWSPKFLFAKSKINRTALSTVSPVTLHGTSNGVMFWL